MPEAGRVGRDASQLPSGETGASRVEQPAAERRAEPDRRDDARSQGGQDAGVAEDPLGQRRREDVEVLGLLGDRAGLDAGPSREPGAGAVAIRGERLLDSVSGMPQRLARGDEQGREISSTQSATGAEAPPSGDRGERPDQRAEIGQLHPGVRRAFEQKQDQGRADRAEQHPERQPGNGPWGAAGQSDPSGRPPRGATFGHRLGRNGRFGALGRFGRRGLGAGQDPGGRDDDDAFPRQLGAPPEVEGFTRPGEGRLETAHLRQDLPADELARQAHRQDVRARVVLSLVGLTATRRSDPATGPGELMTHFHEQPRPVPVQHLRAGHPHRR